MQNASKSVNGSSTYVELRKGAPQWQFRYGLARNPSIQTSVGQLCHWRTGSIGSMGCI